MNASLRWQWPDSDSLTRIVATGGALLFCQMAVRNFILGFRGRTLADPIHYLPRLCLGAFYDVVYAVALTMFFVLLLGMLRKTPSNARRVSIAFTVVAILSLVLVLLNFQFLQIAGAPFSYQWLYYSDFLMSLDAHEAIRANLAWGWMIYVVLLPVGFIALSKLLTLLLGAVRRTALTRRAMLVATTGLLAVYLPAGALYVRSHDLPDGTYDQAVLFFLKTWLIAQDPMEAVKSGAEVSHDDFLPVADRPPEKPRKPLQSSAGVRNVILFVMESVGAQYVEPFGGKYPVTPTLNRYRNKAALFDRIYTSCPSTVKALWSLECSIYPWINNRFIVREHPEIDVPSLSSTLKDHDYRTAFFNSGDNRYQREETFLAARGFDLVEDYRMLGRSRPVLVGTDWQHSEDGCDDRATVARLADWIDKDPDKPFFGMLWTVLTHYPYYALGPEIDYGTGDAMFNRYLNGLRVSDEALGNLLAHLEKRGLLDSTLVVVIGDHGEAFGQHKNSGHDDVFDECSRVPFMLINPRLFHGEVYHQPGGSVDVAPTVLDILGHSLPGAWQGRSLFSVDRSNRAYFFHQFRGYWLGYREEDRVLLWNLNGTKFKLFNMANDPMQQVNLADQHPELISAGKARLAAWMHFQNAYVTKLMDAPPRPAPAKK